MPAERMVSKKS